MVIIISILASMAVAHWSWYLLRSIDDASYKPNHPFLSKANILVGVVGGALEANVYMIYGLSLTFIIYSLMVLILIGVAIVDWNSYEIPIWFNYLLLALGIVRLISDYKHWPRYIIGMLLVSGIFYILLLLTKGRGMGGGDVKLMFTCGLIVGWQLILLTMILGSILGALIHSIIMKVSKKEHMLAFGPYLAAGAYISICYGSVLIEWYLSFFPHYGM